MIAMHHPAGSKNILGDDFKRSCVCYPIRGFILHVTVQVHNVDAWRQRELLEVARENTQGWERVKVRIREPGGTRQYGLAVIILYRDGYRHISQRRI